MRWYRAAVAWVLLSHSSSLVNAKNTNQNDVMNAPQRRSAERMEIEVDYEYQLEVNQIRETGTTSNVLAQVDLDILGNLQEALPNGGTDESNEIPNVKFESIDSTIYSACFTKSEQCSLVRSKILVSYDGTKPDHSVEQVTLNLVQDYLNNFSQNEETVLVTYQYPFAVSALAHFEIWPVLRPMDDIEVQVLEDTFLEVFGAIVAAMEGDSAVLNAEFLYQDLFALVGGRRKLRKNPRNLIESNVSQTDTTDGTGNNETDIFQNTRNDVPSTLKTDMLLTGYCRECTDQEFGKIVKQTISQNLIAYKNKLKGNGAAASSDYFDGVVEVTYKVPELPTKLPPIADESIFDDDPPIVDKTVPWFVFLGLSLGLCILLTGGYIIYKENMELEKEDDEMSTSDSDFADDPIDEDTDSANEGEDEEAAARGHGDGERDYVGDTYVDGTYDELEEYQVETIAPTDDGKGSDYEVYVF